MRGILPPLAALAVGALGASPLPPLAWSALPHGTVTPTGWLARELRLQADALSGTFFEDYWEPVNNSQWLGGTSTQEDWVEIFPYVFQGFVPQAIQLNDSAQLATSERWINAILARASPNGWLGPLENLPGGMLYWPRWPIVLTFLAWHEYGVVLNGTGDARVLDASLAWCAIAYTNLTTNFPLDNSWSGFRWQDFIFVAQALMDYKYTPPSAMPLLQNLSAAVYAQGTRNIDWERKWYTAQDFPKEGVPSWNILPHGVNNAMATKSGAVVWRGGLNPEGNTSSYTRVALYDAYHAAPSGIFQADECLAGAMPSRGSETCLVVELMYSYSIIHEFQGDAFFADREERVAYNALPGALTKDLWARVYLQQANEVTAEVLNPHVWVSDGDDALVYSLNDNYDCCTANYNQGWPRHIQHMLHASPDGGVAVSVLGPVSASLPNGAAIAVTGDYPFDDDVTVTLSGLPAGPVVMPLYIRIPAWATAATLAVNGGAPVAVGAQNGTMVAVDLGGAQGPSVSVVLATNPAIRVEAYYAGALSVYRGALLYALALGENITVTHNYTGGARDYVITQPANTSVPWNAALVGADPAAIAAAMTFERSGPPGPVPFEAGQSPVQITATVRTLNTWPIVDGSAGAPPQSPVDCSAPDACSGTYTATLVPFGSTHLRMASLPWTTAV